MDLPDLTILGQVKGNFLIPENNKLPSYTVINPPKISERGFYVIRKHSFNVYIIVHFIPYQGDATY